MIRNLWLLCALVVATEPLLAATPESGTITNEKPTLEWTGGPFLVPNLTPTLGLVDQQPVCEEGTPTCDVFRFEVQLTSANLDDDTVVISVGWEGSINLVAATVPDYDLYLYDDVTGDLLLTQASAANPEIIILPPQNGKYRLVVIPFADMAEPYAGKVQFVKFEEEKNQALAFFGGAFGAGTLIVLAGFGAMLRKTLPVLALLVAGTAGAATPASGKISEGQRTTEWSGGPIFAPNPYPTVPVTECREGTPICDVFRFEADLPNANPDDDVITITLGWATTQLDFDLYVFDEATGEEVGSGTANAGGRDVAIIPAVSGKYKVVVYPWAATAETYTGVVKYEPFEEEKSSVLGVGAFGAGTLLLLAGLGLTAGLRRRAATI